MLSRHYFRVQKQNYTLGIIPPALAPFSLTPYLRLELTPHPLAKIYDRYSWSGVVVIKYHIAIDPDFLMNGFSRNKNYFTYLFTTKALKNLLKLYYSQREVGLC